MNHPNNSTATKLLRAIIAKTFIEILFVCAVASLAAFSIFSPLLRGAIDVADQSRVAGWAHDPLAPGEPIEVQLFIDGNFAAAKRADERRDDLVRAGAAKHPNHGFSFDVGLLNLSEGVHTAQVYAARKAPGAHQVLIPISKSLRTIRVDH
jgi:hypothetical protein